MSEPSSAAELSSGSIWRRWDPHVHLPGTLLNDQFGSTTVEQALNDLAACQPQIEAAGITDYFTTASFRKAVAAHEAGAGEKIGFLFPNVELRLDIQVASGSGVNIHLLSAPEDVEWLDRFVARLEFNYGDQQYRADGPGLVALGRAFLRQPTLGEEAARREGARQFKVSFAQLREEYKKDGSAPERLLVAVAGGQGDGTSGVRTAEGGFSATRRSIERFAQIILSGNDQQREFWLGRGVDSAERILQVYGGLKPCMQGSDAHASEELGRPSNERYTWLKGDPSFDTLRLACLAPETRVSVGSASPVTGHEEGRITSITVDDPSWFLPGTVPINPGLVAIIGARGSGKTALADLIAVGAGSNEPFDNPSSFVARASAFLVGTTSTVRWHEGEITQQELVEPGWSDDGPSDSRVRYLSQQFVERLCASDGVSDELRKEIERVIYDSWPVNDRQGAMNFKELLDIRLGSARDQQAAELETIKQIGDQITDIRVKQHHLPRKHELLRGDAGTAEQLEKQIQSLTAHAAPGHGERYAAVSKALGERQETVQALGRRITELRSLKAAAETAQQVQFPRFAENLKRRYPFATLTDEQWALFIPAFSGDVMAVLDSAITGAEADQRGVAGEPLLEGAAALDDIHADDLAQLTVAALKAEQIRLERLVGLDRQRAEQLRRVQQQLTDTRARIARLKTEIADAESAGERDTELVEARAGHYAAYFSAILEEADELKRLYAPLRDILNSFGESVAKLSLSVTRRVDLRSWVEQGEALIDLRTSGPFHGSGEMARIARESLFDAWSTGTGEEAAAAIQQFSHDYSRGFREQSRVSPNDEDAYRDWERRVAQWIYGVGHITVAYSLEYDGLDVQRLSPGTRGIVLLLLYLAVDQSETDPLIIDQPEENLDPESVYTELVRLFRKASDRRQVIMITHNANLVVNTDVDQVLVARCGSVREGKLPEFSYLSGGLEDPLVRKAVCDVLEGGEEAFRQRARRLHIDVPTVVPED